MKEEAQGQVFATPNCSGSLWSLLDFPDPDLRHSAWNGEGECGPQGSGLEEDRGGVNTVEHPV